MYSIFAKILIEKSTGEKILRHGEFLDFLADFIIYHYPSLSYSYPLVSVSLDACPHVSRSAQGGTGSNGACPVDHS